MLAKPILIDAQTVTFIATVPAVATVPGQSLELASPTNSALPVFARFSIEAKGSAFCSS